MINPFKKTYTETELELFKFLSKVKLFERLTYDEMSVIVPYLNLRSYSKDEIVFFRGDPSNALYIVKEGGVALNIDVQDKFEQLAAVPQGKAFGDNAILDNTKRVYSVVVTTERAELYVLPKVQLDEIFEEHEEIKAKLLLSFSETYNAYFDNLFIEYKKSHGFFNLGTGLAEIIK